MIRISAFIFLAFITTQICASETQYQKNLQLASELFVAKSELPDSVLLKLVPDNYEEFNLLYGTTSPNSNMKNTGFFYKVTRQIFNKYIIEKKEKFYLPCLQLASFADGEFGEQFVRNLELIVNLDKNKFCESIKDKNYTYRNPIRYYSIQNGCQ